MQFPVGVKLNRIKGNILIFFGMPDVLFAVKQGPIGL